MNGRSENGGVCNGSHSPGTFTLSLVIPCWNDLDALRVQLDSLRGLSGIAETIVADASTSDECRRLAAESGAYIAHCPAPNRGAQMNAGARLATSEVLLFHHADTELTQPHIDSLRGAMRDAAIVGGAFHRKFDGRHPHLRWLEQPARILCERGGTLYGDQSVFVRRDVFAALGGFAAIPLMEDIEFSRRLRRFGTTVVIDPPIHSSSRHHDRRGSIRTSLRNGAMIALYRLGFPPAKLHAWYYR